MSMREGRMKEPAANNGAPVVYTNVCMHKNTCTHTHMHGTCSYMYTCIRVHAYTSTDPNPDTDPDTHTDTSAYVMHRTPSRGLEK